MSLSKPFNSEFADAMTRQLEIGGMVLLGIVMSLAIALGCAWLLAGAGHGWCSSIWSGLIVFFLPVLGLGFLTHNPRSAKRVAWYVCSGFIAVDGMLVCWTSFVEGWSGFLRTWAEVPSLLVGWAVVWLALHACAALLWRRAHRFSEPDIAPNGPPQRWRGIRASLEGGIVS